MARVWCYRAVKHSRKARRATEPWSHGAIGPSRSTQEGHASSRENSGRPRRGGGSTKGANPAPISSSRCEPHAVSLGMGALCDNEEEAPGLLELGRQCDLDGWLVDRSMETLGFRVAACERMQSCGKKEGWHNRFGGKFLECFGRPGSCRTCTYPTFVCSDPKVKCRLDLDG